MLIRYLKGHAADYALDPATWRHYRRAKLDTVNLFRVLRPFHEDGAKLQVWGLCVWGERESAWIWLRCATNTTRKKSSSLTHTH